jgi:hypothetical protein
MILWIKPDNDIDLGQQYWRYVLPRAARVAAFQSPTVGPAGSAVSPTIPCAPGIALPMVVTQLAGGCRMVLDHGLDDGEQALHGIVAIRRGWWPDGLDDGLGPSAGAFDITSPDRLVTSSAGRTSVAEMGGVRAGLAIFSYRNVRWEERMPDYRIYWLDQDNRISSADDLTIDTDEAALSAAEVRLGTGSSDGGLTRGAAHWARVRKETARANFLNRRQPIEDDALMRV